MIKLSAQSTKNVTIHFLTDRISMKYTLATTQPVGMYTNESGFIYHVESRYIRGKHRNYATYSLYVEYQTNLEVDINKKYFYMKKLAMLDARQYKLSILPKVPKNAKQIENLEKDIEFLKNLEFGKPFELYGMGEHHWTRQQLINAGDLPF